MASTTPYRSLPAERRIGLVAHAITADRQIKEAFVQRLLSRGGGFRRETLRKLAPTQLAREVVRGNLETAQEELAMLQALYVELEPAIQIDFLEVAGVPHEGGTIPEDLKPPFADAPSVQKAAHAVLERHGPDGRRYLETIALYNGDAWPGIGDIVVGLSLP